MAGLTQAGSMATWSKCAVPLAVSAWPKPSQSSSTCTPEALRGTSTSVGLPSSSSAATLIQSANSEPVV